MLSDAWRVVVYMELREVFDEARAKHLTQRKRLRAEVVRLIAENKRLRALVEG